MQKSPDLCCIQFIGLSGPGPSDYLSARLRPSVFFIKPGSVSLRPLKLRAKQAYICRSLGSQYS